MALKDLFDRIKNKVKNAAVVRKAKAQVNKHDLGTTADIYADEFVTPKRTDTGVPQTQITEPDYVRAESTEFVRKNGLSGIYFSDALTHDLKTTLEDEYKNSHLAKFVYVPASTFPADFSEEEIQELSETYEIERDSNNRPRMLVSTFRQWQVDILRNNEQAATENKELLTPFYDAAKGFAKTARNNDQAEPYSEFVLDSLDDYHIAETYGGEKGSLLNSYSKYANIPVSVLALHAVLSTKAQYKSGERKGDFATLEFTKSEPKKVTKPSYKRIREALGEDPLVGFLDELCGYTIGADGKPVELTTETGEARQGLFEHMLPLASSVQSKVNREFKLDIEHIVTKRDVRVATTKLDSDCDRFVRETKVGSSDVSARLSESATEFAQTVINGSENTSGTMNRFITRRERSLLRTAFRNVGEEIEKQTTQTTIPKYKGIYEKLNGEIDFSAYSEDEKRFINSKKYPKFKQPKDVDVELTYASEFGVIKNNALLINNIELNLAPQIDVIDRYPMETEEAIREYASTYGINLDEKALQDLAKKYDVKLPAQIDKEYLKLAVKLQTKQQVDGIKDFNESVVQLVDLKEDLRVCEQVIGQFKFNNLGIVADVYAIAKEKVKVQQEALRQQMRTEQLEPAKAALERLENERIALLQQKRELRNTQKTNKKELETLTSTHQTKVIEAVGEQFKEDVSAYIVSTSQNGKRRAFNVKSKEFGKIVERALSKLDPSVVLNENGEINFETIESVLGREFLSIATANYNFASGTKNEKLSEARVKPFVDLCLKNVRELLESDKTILSTKRELQLKIKAIENVDNALKENETEIEQKEEQISAQEQRIDSIETEIKNIESIPTKALIEAQKRERENLARVKVKEFEQVIKTINEVKGIHQETEQELITKGVLVRNDQGVLQFNINKETSALLKSESPEILAAFTSGFEKYNSDSERLTTSWNDKLERIVEMAKDDFDLVIVLDEQGQPKFDASGNMQYRHIDNPTRVKGDLSDDVIELYESQKTINACREIIELTGRGEDISGIIENLPEDVRENLPEDEQARTEFLNETIQSELQQTEPIRAQYAAMTDEQKQEFQQGYARYDHYVSENYIDADKVDETLNPELARVDSLLSERAKQPEAQTEQEEVVVDELGEEVEPIQPEETQETTFGTRTDYSADVEKFVGNYSILRKIEQIQEASNEERLQLVNQNGWEQFRNFIDENGQLKPEASDGLAKVRSGYEQLNQGVAMKYQVGTPQFNQFLDQSVEHYAQTQREESQDGAELTDEERRETRNNMEEVLVRSQHNARTAEQTEEAESGVNPKKPELEEGQPENDKNKKPVKIEYTAKGCELALKSINKLIEELEKEIKAQKQAEAATETPVEEPPVTPAEEVVEEAHVETIDHADNAYLRQAYLGMVYDQLFKEVGGMTPEQTAALFAKMDVEISDENFAEYIDKDGKLNVPKMIKEKLGIEVADQKRAVTAQVSTVKTGKVNEEGKVVNARGVSVEEKLYERFEAGNPDEAVKTILDTKSPAKRKYIVRNLIIHALGKGLIDQETVRNQARELGELLQTNGYEVTEDNIKALVAGTLPQRTAEGETPKNIDVSVIKDKITGQIKENVPQKETELG